MLRAEEVERKEEELRAQVARLPDRTRAWIWERFRHQYRDPDTYATLNYLLVAGLHHFYLGRWLRGSLNLTVFLLGVALCLLGLWPAGLALILIISLLELPALFRAQIIVQHHNNRLLTDLLRQADAAPAPSPDQTR